MRFRLRVASAALATLFASSAAAADIAVFDAGTGDAVLGQLGRHRLATASLSGTQGPLRIETPAARRGGVR